MKLNQAIIHCAYSRPFVLKSGTDLDRDVTLSGFNRCIFLLELQKGLFCSLFELKVLNFYETKRIADRKDKKMVIYCLKITE